jgi:hypothetical protein
MIGLFSLSGGSLTFTLYYVLLICTTFSQGERMVPYQLEKLKKDSKELDHCIARMNKEGRSDNVSQLQMKKARIDSYIQQMTELKYTYH